MKHDNLSFFDTAYGITMKKYQCHGITAIKTHQVQSIT